MQFAGAVIQGAHPTVLIPFVTRKLPPGPPFFRMISRKIMTKVQPMQCLPQ